MLAWTCGQLVRTAAKHHIEAAKHAELWDILMGCSNLTRAGSAEYCIVPDVDAQSYLFLQRA